MSKRHVAVGASLLGLVAAGALSFGQGSASADIAPQAQDVVGVGSDVIQNSVDFLADGSPSGLPGFNSAGNVNRLFNFDASADANGRNAFTDPSLGTSVALNPSVVLRAGTSPVLRPNGGGAGITALEKDTAGAIDFARSPNLPKAADQTTATSNLGSKLYTIQFADDKQYIATAATTNAPAVGLTPAQLAGIYCSNAANDYTTWDQVGGTGTSTIVAERPQDSAGVLKQFQAVLQAGNGNTACTWKTSVKAVQQNDPSTVAGNPDAIVPFPQSRYKLLQQNYFPDPSSASYTGSVANGSDGKTTTPLSASGITLQVPGSNGVSASAYVADLPFYVIFRESAIDSNKAWQPGSTLNWVRTLFYNPAYDPDDASGAPAPWIVSAAGQQLISSLGLTPYYPGVTANAVGVSQPGEGTKG
ncbi:hypothetical protein P5P86_17975 [Nocardioides sp. BP30]|uniref:hypothetical protein n=1 Tax=Nocardioides sp. BP30 TaxID=3036374 RepID=UPI002469B573|nr:hypothetical protein [Nocardioides sp. BP30]WGL51830.1 hypothetical protein P5P86_17975 [Nocardioides sp. BP30]